MAGVAGGEQARDPGLSPTSTRRTVLKMDSGASALAPLLDGSTAGELIPELVRHGLQASSSVINDAQTGGSWP